MFHGVVAGVPASDRGHARAFKTFRVVMSRVRGLFVFDSLSTGETKFPRCTGAASFSLHRRNQRGSQGYARRATSNPR